MPLYRGSRRLILTRRISSFGPPLDGITTGIKAAYSTRKLLTAYAGSPIRVQRISDNSQQDIGFVANVLDTASLATFCSGTTGKVITWYDQGGGGFDQTRVAVSAPIIYQSGAVNAINTKPAILFVAATPTNLHNTSLSSSPVNTLFQNAVVSINTAAVSGVISSGVGGTGPFAWRIDQTTGKLEILAELVASIATSTSGISSLTGAVVESQYNSSTGLWSFWIDRTAVGSGTQIQALGASTSVIGIGEFETQEPLDGSIGELIMYDLVGGIPTASQTSIENNQKAYWGTP